SETFKKHEQVKSLFMNSADTDRESGNTIFAIYTANRYEDITTNLLDTPGLADFIGDVQRIMNKVDDVILVVNAYELTMPQAGIVLKKALEQKLKPFVVLYKVDRPNARPEEVVDEVLDLFIELCADDDQLEFPVLYASALNGTSGTEPEDQQETMDPIFEGIMRDIPAPKDNSDEPL